MAAGEGTRLPTPVPGVWDVKGEREYPEASLGRGTWGLREPQSRNLDWGLLTLLPVTDWGLLTLLPVTIRC